MSQIFDGIKEGLVKVKASQELQDSVQARINDAIATADVSQAEPYRHICLSIIQLLKQYDDKYYGSEAERYIKRILEGTQVIAQNYVDYEKNITGRLKLINNELQLTPSWMMPVQLLMGILGFAVGAAGVILLGIPIALLFNTKISHFYFVFVAAPAGIGLAKEFFQGIAMVIEDARIPRALEKNPQGVAELFLYKAMMNLLPVCYQNPMKISTVRSAVADATAALVIYNSEMIFEIVRNTVDHLKPRELNTELVDRG